RLIASAYLIAEDNFWACVSDSPPSSIFCSPVDCSYFFGAPCFLKISANEASTASGFSLNNSYCSSTYSMFGPKKLFQNLLLFVVFFTSKYHYFDFSYSNCLFF